MCKCQKNNSCYPGADPVVYTTYPKGCTSSQNKGIYLPLRSQDIYYSGPNLPYSGVQTLDNLNTTLQKIDEKLSPEQIVNLIITLLNTNDTIRQQLCAALNCS